MPAAGLRERKYLRTRAQLIQTAVEICLETGYESATVERIAASADVSPRTFSRYFASKDAVFLALLEPMSDEILDELTKQTGPATPLGALRAAHASLLTRIANRPYGKPSADQLAVIVRIINASSGLRNKIIDYRDERVMSYLAERTGVPVGDQRLELAMTLFNLAIVTACANAPVDANPDHLGASDVIARTRAVLADVSELVNALDHG